MTVKVVNVIEGLIIPIATLVLNFSKFFFVQSELPDIFTSATATPWSQLSCSLSRAGTRRGVA